MLIARFIDFPVRVEPGAGCAVGRRPSTLSAQPALTIREDLRTATIELELRRLHRQLTVPPVASASVVVDLRDQMRIF